MPRVQGKENKAKLSKIYKICNAMQSRNGMSNEKKENCIRGISKKWGLTKSKMSKTKKKKKKS
jgi:hypothetical protein